MLSIESIEVTFSFGQLPLRQTQLHMDRLSFLALAISLKVATMLRVAYTCRSRAARRRAIGIFFRVISLSSTFLPGIFSVVSGAARCCSEGLPLLPSSLLPGGALTLSCEMAEAWPLPEFPHTPQSSAPAMAQMTRCGSQWAL